LRTSDIEIKNLDIPFLAEFIYKMYPYDALNFEIDAIQRTIEFLPQLYPEAGSLEIEKMIQILRLQTAIKFCQYAENLAAIAIAFQSSYDDEKQEMVGIFNKISRYNLGEIYDFYNSIGNRENKYFAKFYGYPPLLWQSTAARYFLDLSCGNLREVLTEVAEMYSQLRPLYNAYKHGYRVLFGKNSYSADIFPFVTDQGKQMYTEINEVKLKRILILSLQCRKILESIFKQHHIRRQYEARGGQENAIKVDLFLRRNDKHPSQEEDLHLFYPTRGDRRKSELSEGEKVYAIFKEQLEKDDKGKIVAIDIDEKRIISKDYDKHKVLSGIRSAESSGRIHIRRVSQDGKVDFEIY
jgi:hypothetical protein